MITYKGLDPELKLLTYRARTADRPPVGCPPEPGPEVEATPAGKGGRPEVDGGPEEDWRVIAAHVQTTIRSISFCSMVAAYLVCNAWWHQVKKAALLVALQLNPSAEINA